MTTGGMLFVNGCTWAHILLRAARLLDLPRERLLREEELGVLDGKAAPHGIVI